MGLGGLDGVQRAYARLAIYGRWLGIHFPESATPDERRYQMVGEVPQGDQPITTITRAYIAGRYGNPADRADDRAPNEAVTAWQQARRVFIRAKWERFWRRSSN